MFEQATGHPAPNELTRKIVHVAMGLPALLLPWFSWSAMSLIAVLALVVNTQVLPYSGLTRGLFRPDEKWGGIAVYPLVVLVLLVVFRSSTFPAAAGWMSLAFGDGAASLVGRVMPIRPLPGAARKSVGGTLACFVATSAAVGAAGLRHGMSPPSLVVCALTTGAVVALGEAYARFIDDNVVAAVLGAAVAAGFDR